MEYQELADFLQFVGKDPTTLIFEDELTGIHNRRFILRYLQHKVDWESGSDYPLALLNLDLDNFKEINDGHGHEMGDQVLAWVATLLESVAGEEGLPARYGGDEFLIVLPDTDREGALAVSARLLQTTHDHPFRERDSGLTVPVRLSIGVAVAPEDGQLPDELIHAADTALYVAKHRGRDQAALASELGEESVFPKVALQRLRLQGIAGREEELGAVDRALRGMTSGRSQVLVFEGPPGVGKTTFLEAIDSNLKADRSIMVTRVSGDLKEARRPYYLAARILVDLLNQRGDEGVALLHRLPEAGKAYLAHVMPGLTDGEVPGVLDIEARRGIFTAFTSLLGQAVEDRTLILLIDDMEFADEATFLLLSTAAERGDISFMLCGTVGETLRLSGETQPSPLERFLEDCPDEIRLRNMALRPLGPMAIAEYLNAVFPNLQVPPRFEAELAGVTGGNPFFVSEIIRTLLEDGKVQLVGQNWVIEPVDTADLARSLEGIVTEKIAALDQEERAILERASTLGEEIPVSVLTGSSALDESSVQAFLDRAESLGLVKVGFQVNDEVMRFLGKGILDISYAAIADTRREELHGELGQYQERLFQQGLLSSASILAYHFRRSTDQAKARRYEQTQRAYADTVFHRTEISHYKAGMDTWKVAASVIEEVVEEIKAVTPQDAVVDAIEAGMPLDAEATALVPQALRMILSAMRNVQLYPPESMAITRAMEQAMGTLGAILVRTGRFTLTYDEDGLIANGVPLDLSEVGALEKSVLDLLREAELRAVSFTRDVKVNEVRSLLLTMGTVVPGAIDRDFWRKVCQKEGFRSLEVRQTQYTRIDPSAGGARRADAGGPLSPSEMAPIPDLIRDFIKTASDARLYPPGSERVTDSISALLSSFQPILHRRSSLSLARLEDFVMVNGERVDTTQWESVAAGFTSFLDSAGLLSMTFHSNLSREDLGAFFAQLRDQGGRCPEPGFWERFASEKGLRGIAFNLEAYAPEVIEALLASALQRQAPRPAVARPAPPVPRGRTRRVEPSPEGGI
jgi:diguanylate cyclase (GGDEF)-like protein